MPSFKILSRKTFIIHVFLRCATQTVSRHTNVTKAQQPHNFCPRFSPPSHTATPPHSLTRYAYLRHAPGWATTGFRRPSLPLLSQRLTTYEPLHGSPGHSNANLIISTTNANQSISSPPLNHTRQSQRQRGDTTHKQGGSVPEVHVSRYPTTEERQRRS